MGGMNRHNLIYAEKMIKYALEMLAEADEHIGEAYSATLADPEDIGAAMVLTPEFEIIAQRKDKLESALIAAQKILQEALK